MVNEEIREIIEELLEKCLLEFENRIENKILHLESKIDLLSFSRDSKIEKPIHAGSLRPSWISTLSLLKKEFDVGATIQILAEKMEIKRSVASSYLSKLSELNLVKRKHNHTDMPGRYLFVLTELGQNVLMQIENFE